MALPYAASFYFFMRADSEREGGDGTLLSGSAGLVAAGLLTGAAALFKQIGVLNLAFFALYEVVAVWKSRRKRLEGRNWLMAAARRVVTRLSLIAIGFALVLGSFVLWLKSMGALGDFWRNAVVLNKFYIDSQPAGLWMTFLVGRGLGYLFFNLALWSLAALTVWRLIRELKGNRKTNADVTRSAEETRFDMATAFWCGISLLTVMMGGRFFGHYFIPSLPALSLLGARGSVFLAETLRRPAFRRKGQAAVVALVLLFLIGFIRCHHRTAVLAYETLTGTRTGWSANWGMTKREDEAKVVSRFVGERVPPGEPLYIWGYAHDVFWLTRCRPASRYLTPYYIDGRFPDAEGTVTSSSEEFRREAAANLIEDLRRSKPRLILDVEGNFKALPQPKLVEFIENNYQDAGNAGPNAGRPFQAFVLKDTSDPPEIENQGVR